MRNMHYICTAAKKRQILMSALLLPCLLMALTMMATPANAATFQKHTGSTSGQMSSKPGKHEYEREQGPRGLSGPTNPSSMNRIYVTIPIDNTVSVIDGTTNTVIATIPVGSSPVGVGVNPATNRIYVANFADNTVSVIDGTTDEVIATIPVGTLPHGVGVNPLTNGIYVANSFDNTVSVIDGNTDEVIATIPVVSRPLDVGVNP